MLERSIEKKFCEMIRQRGGLTYKFTSSENGVPDRIVITLAGVVWFVELKTKQGRLSKIQSHQISRLKEHGANVRVIRGWDAAKKFIEEVTGDAERV